MKSARPLVIAGLIALLFIAGCASTTAGHSQELLRKDYRTMSDADLQTYYYQLNDQIARVERESRGTRVGVGIGTPSLQVGASTDVVERTVADDLRDRRNEVRQELSRRGLRD